MSAWPLVVTLLQLFPFHVYFEGSSLQVAGGGGAGLLEAEVGGVEGLAALVGGVEGLAVLVGGVEGLAGAALLHLQMLLSQSPLLSSQVVQHGNWDGELKFPCLVPVVVVRT